ncbi:DEAD/DEAH box helicase [Empedobacter falsenii]|uniref:DEAD/DEAH box helicase n=1 Tax=Empedobacter sp. GD03797 TaxID=2975382 RepID=UPI00244CF486|nr:ATP-binding domain-containing protein [Empedobacter sp. GD03797]MDH1883698.1 ATP-binding domain-containing protein [Empedobacter sp. GD03797]
MNIIADELKLKQDIVANLLVEKIKSLGLENSILYYNFPFYRGETTEDLVKAHVLLISKEYGVIFFRCLNEVEDYSEIERKKINELDSHIFAKINKREEFRLDRRTLKIKVTPYIFINNSKSEIEDILSLEDVEEAIKNNKTETLTDLEFDLLSATIEGTLNLKKKSDRIISQNVEKLTKGKILSLIQNREATFDIEQKRAALNIIDSPQRIRGLAGSGKTVILAMKAALFHLQNPEAEILYTYFTKALYGQVQYLIEKFYRDFSDNQEPNWDKINILHGWGGNSLRGVYSDTCFDNQIPAISFGIAKSMRPKNPFEYIFEELNKNILKEKYDLTLIDEGQDFNKYFYQVCYKITKNKRLVWAYDDFQNIFDIEIQDEKETFGINDKGNYNVDFQNSNNVLQDIILYKCYRNPRYVLTSAFSLGLGIYNDRVLQRLENNKHWEDLGFKVVEGNSNTGDKMVIERPEESSPIETNEYFNEESITINVFDDLKQETDFVCGQILNDITVENLNPDDVCVISLDQRNIKAYFTSIEKKLQAGGVKVFNLLNAPNNNTKFNIKGCVTLSTINKAKGNEVGMVYVVGVDSAFANKDYIINRNQLFTAITRSKGWVKLTGHQTAELCKNELNSLKENKYKLIFTQPSETETRTIYRGLDKMQSELNILSRTLEKLSKETGLSLEEILKTIENQNQKK